MRVLHLGIKALPSWSSKGTPLLAFQQEERATEIEKERDHQSRVTKKQVNRTSNDLNLAL